MNTAEIMDGFKRNVMPTYAPGKVLVKGRGVKVWDADGNEYLDFLAGISVLNVGHCHPRVVEAIRKQAGELVHVSNLYYTEPQVMLAEKLNIIALGGKCFFGNSGAEANEGLIKLARLWGHDEGRYEIICMKNSFHGRTLATAAATGQSKVQKGFEPMPAGFVHAEYNNIDSIKALLSDRTVAIMLEAIQGEGGIIAAQPEFMHAVKELCNKENLLMLCDEVQCGLGRTGKWFGYQHYDLEPDAFSLAKALGSGYPIGAVVSGEKLKDVFQPGKHASTFGGTPLACAAALATLQVIDEEGLVDNSALMGAKFKAGLQVLADKYDQVETVRGVGLMIGLVMKGPAADTAKKLIESGLLCLATAETVVRFLPPLTVNDENVAQALEIIEKCLSKE